MTKARTESFFSIKVFCIFFLNQMPQMLLAELASLSIQTKLLVLTAVFEYKMHLKLRRMWDQISIIYFEIMAQCVQAEKNSIQSRCSTAINSTHKWESFCTLQ